MGCRSSKSVDIPPTPAPSCRPKQRPIEELDGRNSDEEGSHEEEKQRNRSESDIRKSRDADCPKMNLRTSEFSPQKRILKRSGPEEEWSGPADRSRLDGNQQTTEFLTERRENPARRDGVCSPKKSSVSHRDEGRNRSRDDSQRHFHSIPRKTSEIPKRDRERERDDVHPMLSRSLQKSRQDLFGEILEMDRIIHNCSAHCNSLQTKQNRIPIDPRGKCSNRRETRLCSSKCRDRQRRV